MSPVEEAVERVQASHLVQAMLGSLIKAEREVLLLHYLEGFTVREMAGLLKRTPKAVESLLTRARKKAAEAGIQWMQEGPKEEVRVREP